MVAPGRSKGDGPRFGTYSKLDMARCSQPCPCRHRHLWTVEPGCPWTNLRCGPRTGLVRPCVWVSDRYRVQVQFRFIGQLVRNVQVIFLRWETPTHRMGMGMAGALQTRPREARVGQHRQRRKRARTHARTRSDPDVLEPVIAHVGRDRTCTLHARCLCPGPRAIHDCYVHSCRCNDESGVRAALLKQ